MMQTTLEMPFNNSVQHTSSLGQYFGCVAKHLYSGASRAVEFVMPETVKTAYWLVVQPMVRDALIKDSQALKGVGASTINGY